MGSGNCQYKETKVLQRFGATVKDYCTLFLPSGPYRIGTPLLIWILIFLLLQLNVAKSCPTHCNSIDSRLLSVPLSMGFSRQEYLGKCHLLLQGIFQAQGLKPCLLQCRQILSLLSHQGSPSLFWGKG